MNWYKIFYWMTVADNIKLVTGWISVIAGIYVLCSFLSSLGAFEYPWNTWEKATKRLAIIFTLVFFISIFSWMFIPSKKDMMVIVAGGAIGNFVSTDSSSKAIPAELTRYVRSYLKKNADDLDLQTKQDLGVETPKDKLIDKAKKLTKDELINYLQTDTTILKEEK